MKTRSFAWLALLMAALAQASSASAQAYPAKPVRILVASSPGGPYDDTARALGPKLTELWGQTVIVENRPGAGGTIGAAAAAKAPADGYTLFLANAGPITINPSLQKSLPYHPQRDFSPVLLVATSPMVLAAHPSVPVRNVKEMVALARSRPGSLNYASAGVGNLQHLSMELLQSIAGTQMSHVPYKGAAPALVDLTAGQVEVMFANILGSLQFVRSGRLRALAVSSAQRSPQLPQTPSVAETYKQFDVTTWMGLFVPWATPKEIQGKIGADLTTVLQRGDIRERFSSLGSDIAAAPPERLAQLIRHETELYAKVIKTIGLVPE